MNKNPKSFLSKALAVALTVLMLVTACMFVVSADESPVAKVGNTEYATIDDAIANWANGTTLTLLADVTLSDVIKLSSTEYHVLDLGTYTMTAAKGKDAIQIVNNGRSSASYALDIKADAENPGGITATGKAVVKTTGKSGVKDRPIIRFYNGVFTGSNVVSHSGSSGTNCPQFQFHGGVFNGTIYTNRALNQFYGGTFTGSLQMSVDSSAYTLIAGGTFAKLSNMMGSSLNNSKFTIGSAKGSYDREVYVDNNGYYVIAAAEPAEGIEASVSKTPGTNDYFAYSKVATDKALKYTNAELALKNNTSATVTVYADKIDMTDIDFKGTIVVPEDKTLTITVPEKGFAGKIELKKNATVIAEGYKLVEEDGHYVLKKAVTPITEVVVTGSYIYNGSEQTAQITVKAGDVELGADDYSVIGNVETNAGTYTITVTGKGNYEGEVSAEWIIAKKSVTVTVDNKNMVAGNALPELTATVDGCIDGEALLYTVSTAADGKAEGNFEIVADYTANANYDVTVENGTLTVSKAYVRAYATNNAKCKYFDNIEDALLYTMGYNDYGPVYVLEDITVTDTIVFNDPIANTIELQGIAKNGKNPTITCTEDAVPFIKMEAGRLSIKNLVIKTVGDAFVVTGGQLNLQSAGVGTQTLEIISQNGSCLVVEGGSAGVLGATTLKSETGSAIKGTENGTGKVTVGAWSTYTSAPDVVAPEGIPAIGGLDSEDVSIQSGSFSSNVSDFCDEGYAMTQKEDGSWVAAKAVVENSTTGKHYATLADAIEKATAGQTITFLADITEDVTINKKLTINGARFTYTGKMTLKADTTIKNVNFDGKGYNGYAVETRGANYITIENCTAKNYMGFLQTPSGNVLTTVKNVTISDMGYGIKVDYSNEVVLENVDITASVAAVLNSNYGAKTITIKNSKLNILGTWTRNNTTKTNYVFEGENTVGEFKTDAAIDNFKLAKDATLTAPEGLNVQTNLAGYIVKYNEGKYQAVTNFVVTHENMRFGNTLSLLFAVPKYEEFGEGCYVVITHTYLNEEKKLDTATKTIQFNKWDGNILPGYYVVESDGFAAKQMTDEVTVTFYNANGALGATFTSSIQMYAKSVLTDATLSTFHPIVVNMLNYGAAAQVYFGYNTTELANAGLEEDQKALTAFDGTDYLNVRYAEGASTEFFTASGVRFNDSINLIFQFQGMKEELAANLTVTFYDEEGNEIVGCTELAWVEADGAWAVELDTLNIADAYKVIICEVKNGNTGATLTIQDSVAAYVARRLATVEANSTAADLYTAFMNFADSAIAYNGN